MKQDKNINNSVQTKYLQTSLFALLLSCVVPAYAVDMHDQINKVVQTTQTESLCKIKPEAIIEKETFSTDGKTHLQSDKVELSEENISRFKGNVVIQQKDKRIETE
ncbi:MAG: hypothetical protein OQK58_02435, partial [Gammaproteobacteria bacterium]|nr:hypothetical protein [Gammaproteobacteria bacterium]